MVEDVKPGASSADALGGKVGVGRRVCRAPGVRQGAKTDMGKMAIVIGYKGR